MQRASADPPPETARPAGGTLATARGHAALLRPLRRELIPGHRAAVARDRGRRRSPAEGTAPHRGPRLSGKSLEKNTRSYTVLEWFPDLLSMSRISFPGHSLNEQGFKILKTALYHSNTDKSTGFGGRSIQSWES